jgi:hypothetical protein
MKKFNFVRVFLINETISQGVEKQRWKKENGNEER